jgi:hypothetical protein
MKKLHKALLYSVALLLFAPISTQGDNPPDEIAHGESGQFSLDQYAFHVSRASSSVSGPDSLHDGYYFVTTVDFDNGITCYVESPVYHFKETATGWSWRIPEKNKKAYIGGNDYKFKINIKSFYPSYYFQGKWVDAKIRLNFFGLKVDLLPKICEIKYAEFDEDFEEITSTCKYPCYKAKITLTDGSYFFYDGNEKYDDDDDDDDDDAYYDYDDDDDDDDDRELNKWEIGDLVLVSVTPDSVLLMNFGFEDDSCTTGLWPRKGSHYMKVPFEMD